MFEGILNTHRELDLIQIKEPRMSGARAGRPALRRDLNRGAAPSRRTPLPVALDD